MLRLRFAYALSYYPLLGLVITTGLALPPVAILTGLPWMNVNYFDFLAHFWSMPVWLLLGLFLMRRRGMLRPRTAPMVSWEIWLFSLVRWPSVVCGVFGAVGQKLRPRPVTFKVTPKDTGGPRPLPARLVLPFVLLAVALSAVALVGELTSPSAGYVFLCLIPATTYAVVALAVPLLHVREAARAGEVRFTHALPAAGFPLVLGLLASLPVATALIFFPAYVAAVMGW